MEVVMLGCGTSHGVPMLGCSCDVCTGDEPRNRRLRASLRLTWPAAQPGGEDVVVVVDVGPDFRQQALTYGMPRLDAVLLTHAHADHIMGLDDVRIFNFRQKAAIPLYGNAATLEAVGRTFAYVFETGQEGGGKPKLDLRPVDGPFSLAGRTVVPVPVLHGRLEVLGFRLGAFAYITDCGEIPEASFQLLEGVETLILDALRYHPHSTHFSVEEAVAAARRIGARSTIFTHLAHDVDYAAPRVALPAGMKFGYDGLRLHIP